MKYISTRGQSPAVDAAEAILNGLAPDGGLYVPNEWPEVALNLADLPDMTYQEVAKQIFAAFLPDFTESEIEDVVTSAYNQQWDDEKIVPLANFEHLHLLELFHGPTLAFKDIALQALPYLVVKAMQKKHSVKDVAIVTATSGDTGSAALAGFADVAKTKIAILYPEKGISDIQRQQMVSQTGDNVTVIGLKGNFDDAQKKVKELMGSAEFKAFLDGENLRLSSANSINIGRLVPQIVYYFYGYGQLIAQNAIQAGDAIDIAVPTGNFGNILAAYYASQIGLPVHRFRVASNENHVLTDFFETGRYDRNRDFEVTNAPAMDILVSSNLERLLYFAADRDSALVAEKMKELNEVGYYQVDEKLRANLAEFAAAWTTPEQVEGEIKKFFDEHHYLLDPHTAVAAYQYQDDGHHTLMAATASPFKFPQTVLQALGQPVEKGDAALKAVAKLANLPEPKPVRDLFDKKVLHKAIIDPAKIQESIEKAW
ncbi:threonine synthase [Eupransor demetentiae]|uniref:Threonine synthase n=1 Tax=Eupransor demetentiae TaxID=3109584 RepID=A0ABP0ERE6_9LACO|nr:Threonine synthase (ThrC) [Lactobacillaceae bacterium LMG 33000]